MALFTYMTENPDLCTALYGKSWESEFTRNAKKLIARALLGRVARRAAAHRGAEIYCWSLQ
ncbi:hypothetical protein [Gemmiger formicilis]|uniref:hypothetical protein n=1 Tax=Gemmiger formicilis TaxID=745368 RepID=UPI00399368F2